MLGVMRASHRLLFPLLIGTAIAVPALAQSGSGPLTNYPACTTVPPKQDSDQAHDAFKLGKRFFDEADYGSAIHNFVDAYKLDCTKTELLTIVARAFELNGNRPEAVHALQTYLERAQNVSPDDKAQIQRRIDNLKAQTPTQAGSAMSATPTATASAVPTGTGPAASITVPPPPPPPPPGPEGRGHTAGPWIVAALGVLGAGAGAALAAIGRGKVTTAQNDGTNVGCNLTTNPPSCPSTLSKTQIAQVNNVDNPELHNGDTLLTAGWVLVGVGGAALVGGLAWHFLEPTGPAQPSDTRARLTPTVGPGYAGLSLGGKF
jgi:hypothetical protein